MFVRISADYQKQISWRLVKAMTPWIGAYTALVVSLVLCLEQHIDDDAHDGAAADLDGSRIVLGMR